MRSGTTSRRTEEQRRVSDRPSGGRSSLPHTFRRLVESSVLRAFGSSSYILSPPLPPLLHLRPEGPPARRDGRGEEGKR